MANRKVMLDTNAVLRFITNDNNVVRYGCNIYGSTKLDFVDCLLVGYANVNDNPVFTFDNNLKKQLVHKAY